MILYIHINMGANYSRGNETMNLIVSTPQQKF